MPLAIAGVLVSAVCGILTFWEIRHGPGGWSLVPRVAWPALWTAIGSARWSALAFVLLTAATLPFRAIQWGRIVRPPGTFTQRYHATAIGFLAINLLPARLGEITRGMLLARRVRGLSPSLSVGSVVYSRVFDVFAIWVLCLPLPFIVRVKPSKAAVLYGGFAALTAFAFGSVLLAWAARRHGPTLGRWIQRFLGFRVAGVVSRFLRGFGTDIDHRSTVRALGWTLVFEALSGAAYIPVVAAVCPQFPALSTGLYGFAAITVGLALPSTPSGVGVYHLAMLTALLSLGVSPGDALAVAIVTHLGSVVAFVLAGAVSLALWWPAGGRLRMTDAPART